MQSYLIEITARILRHVDRETGRPLVDLIADSAEQSGTGRWASQNALEIGLPFGIVHASVEARVLSTLQGERVRAWAGLGGPDTAHVEDTDQWIRDSGAALYASKIVAFTQGLSLMRGASATYGYALNPGEIVGVWRAGCIIRARLLREIREAFQRNSSLPNLIVDETFALALSGRQQAWRRVVGTGVSLGIPLPAMSAALAYFDAYRSERLPANLIQAQRDFFGAHNYRRLARDGLFHTDWTE